MRLVAELLQLSATDLANHLGCVHLSQLDLAVAEGRAERPRRKDPIVELLTERGREHEAAYFEHLRAQKLVVVKLAAPMPTASRQPSHAMRDGADVIYQAPLADAALARPRRFLAQGSAAERARRLVVRGHRREARDGDARRHDPPALRVLEPARAAARREPRARARRRAAPSIFEPEAIGSPITRRITGS